MAQITSSYINTQLYIIDKPLHGIIVQLITLFPCFHIFESR
jgi:hypothetical protein